jgi:hypothetical protein
VLDLSRAANGKNMRKTAPQKTEMLEEYDFSHGVVGKYAERYAKGTNVVVIDRDLAQVFPDSKSVNDALRRLQQITVQTHRSTSKSRTNFKSAR